MAEYPLPALTLYTMGVLVAVFSMSKSTAVVVREGQSVQLNCSVISDEFGYLLSVTWLRQTGQSAPVSMLSTFYNTKKSVMGETQYHNDFNNSKQLNASMTISMSSLEIRSVRASDSGLYFCVVQLSRHMVFYNTTFLNVTAWEEIDNKLLPDETVPVPSETGGDHGFCSGVCVSVVLILGLLSVLLNLVLLLIIILLKHRSGQTHITVPGHQTSSSPDQALESDSLNYAALNFSKKKKKQRRTSLQTDDPHVVYAATR